MQRSARFVLVGFFFLVTLTQFTNCDGYQAADSTLDSTDAAVACINATCVTETPTNLAITPHLYNGEYAVPATLQEFNLGGDCNEGGYLNNEIDWELYDQNGTKVRDSSMQIASGVTSVSRCINGRFLVYIPLYTLTINNADPVSRIGLQYGNGAAREAYNLHIIIKVADPTTGAGQTTMANVPLTAI